MAGGLDNFRWDLLSDAAKGPEVWAALARKMGPQALRMNLNTLLRHDVFSSVEQLSSTASGSDKRLGQSFYSLVDNVADRIAFKAKRIATGIDRALHRVDCGSIRSHPLVSAGSSLISGCEIGT
jgi:hypothetical protein